MVQEPTAIQFQQLVDKCNNIIKQLHEKATLLEKKRNALKQQKAVTALQKSEMGIKIIDCGIDIDKLKIEIAVKREDLERYTTHAINQQNYYNRIKQEAESNFSPLIDACIVLMETLSQDLKNRLDSIIKEVMNNDDLQLHQKYQMLKAEYNILSNMQQHG